MAKKTVVQLLEEFKAQDAEKFVIVEVLRKRVFSYYSDAKEKVMYGGIIFSLADDFGGVFMYKSHVSFEFSYGFKLKDPDTFLEGKGKYRRHLKFTSSEEKEIARIDLFLQQIGKFE